MQIYHFDQDTLEFLGTSEARKSPREKDVYLLPAHATFIKPIEKKLKENEALVFDLKKENWYVVPDFRGVTYWTKDGVEHKIENLNEKIPEGASREFVPVPKTEKQHLRDLKSATYQHIQNALSALDYDSPDSLAKYAVIENQYKEESEKLIGWVVDAWGVFYDQINAHKNIFDLTVDELKSKLPKAPK